MKIMKTILFTIIMIASAQVFAMEAPPAPPAVNAPQITLEKPRLAFAKQLPGDLQRYLFTLCMEGNLSEIAETILAIAGTSKGNQKYINDNMITILESFPYTDKGINIAFLLQNKKISLPVMQQSLIKGWLQKACESLSEGRELEEAIKNGTVQDVRKILTKNSSLNPMLSRAAFLRKKEALILLLAAGATPSCWPSCDGSLPGITPYLEKEIATILLAWGANPFVRLKEQREQVINLPMPYPPTRKVYQKIGNPETRKLIIEAQEQWKRKLEERRKRLYGSSKITSDESNAASGCVLS